MRALRRGALSALFAAVNVFAQTANIPSAESFDLTAGLPPGWSSAGFVLSTSAPRSSPHCVSATGNAQLRWVRTSVLVKGRSKPAELRWHERRTTSALSFRVAVYLFSGSDSTLLTIFDTIPAANAYTSRSVDLSASVLPDSFSFAWFVLRDNTNSTGVVRLDDIVVAAELPFDLDVSLRPAEPAFVYPDSPTMVPITIVNRRDAPSTDFAVRCSVAYDRTGETLYDRSFAFSPLGPLDSAVFPLHLQFPRPGAYTVTARLEWQDDGDATNNADSAHFEVWYRPSSIVINEVMFAPQKEDEADWVEIFIAGADSIDLSDLSISDKGTQRVPVASVSTVKGPGAYVVITSRAGLDLLYSEVGTILTVPSMPSLNTTTSDAVVIRSRFGGTIDSMAYEPGWSPPGVSLERWSPYVPSVADGNWFASAEAAGATPGHPNSVRQRAVDVGLRRATVLQSETEEGVALTVHVSNEGTLGIPSCRLSVMSDLDFSGTFEAHEEVQRLESAGIAAGDSAQYTLDWTPPITGRLVLLITVDVAGDDNERNDSLTLGIATSTAKGTVVVNEIMFTPAAGQAEWVELYNLGAKPVNLQGFSLSDGPTASGNSVVTDLSQKPVLLHPGAFAVVASDSSPLSIFPSLRDDPYRSPLFVSGRTSGLGLNADEDAVILKDESQTTIDSVRYWSSWHAMFIETTGRSLERIRPDATGTAQQSWTSSTATEGGTPGKVNSVVPPSSLAAVGVSIAPNPFSPDGDGREDVAVVRYTFDAPGVYVRFRLYDDRGREVRTVLNGEWVESAGYVRWDGRNDEGKTVSIGPYIGLLQAWNGGTGFSHASKHVIVVAR